MLDLSAEQAHGELVNTPTQAVTGARWEAGERRDGGHDLTWISVGVICLDCVPKTSIIMIVHVAAANGSGFGEEHCWRHAPRLYDAVHFHEDDVGDAGCAKSARIAMNMGSPAI
eukprot:SAG31_NODE_1493_length_8110_cov_1.991020_7_plen_114_part_00